MYMLIHLSVPNFMVSSKDFSKLQKPENSVKSTDPQTGAVGYQAGMGVFRQLQCLNLLRMATYSAYDKPGSMRENIGEFTFYFISESSNN